MKKLMLRLLVAAMLTSCSVKNDNPESNRETIENQDTIANDTEIEKMELNQVLGVWTDGTGPNASFRIEEDSIYDVEHFERTKYQVANDTIIIFYPDEPFKARILKLDKDSLIYEGQYGISKFWRFKD